MIRSSPTPECNNVNADGAGSRRKGVSWCSHQLLALDSPGSVLQHRVGHLRGVQLPNLPGNKRRQSHGHTHAWRSRTFITLRVPKCGGFIRSDSLTAAQSQAGKSQRHWDVYFFGDKYQGWCIRKVKSDEFLAHCLVSAKV